MSDTWFHSNNVLFHVYIHACAKEDLINTTLSAQMELKYKKMKRLVTIFMKNSSIWWLGGFWTYLFWPWYKFYQEFLFMYVYNTQHNDRHCITLLCAVTEGSEWIKEKFIHMHNHVLEPLTVGSEQRLRNGSWAIIILYKDLIFKHVYIFCYILHYTMSKHQFCFVFLHWPLPLPRGFAILFKYSAVF